MIVTAAQITATNAAMLTLVGNTSHNHVVAFAGGSGDAQESTGGLEDSSNDNSHMHTVTFTP